MTHRDIYIKFMIGYDKANVTSSYPSLTEYEIATFLDKAYLALIAQKVTGNNSRHIGFEQDLKLTEDLGPLVTTKRINTGINTNPIPYVSNALSCSKPDDWLYFVSGEMKRGTGDYEKTWDMQLISHDVASKFQTTAYNIPWIKHPVCYEEGNRLYVLYDSILQTAASAGSPSFSLTYIKRPKKFMVNDDPTTTVSGTPLITSPYIDGENVTLHVGDTFQISYMNGDTGVVQQNVPRIISVSSEQTAQGGTIYCTAQYVGEGTLTFVSTAHPTWTYSVTFTVVPNNSTPDPESQIWYFGNLMPAGFHASGSGSGQSGDNPQPEIQPATLITAPTAKSLTYNGSAQQLINPGVASGGTLMYRMVHYGSSTAWSSEIPTFTSADIQHQIYYMIVGDSSHSDVTFPNPIDVEISQKQLGVTWGNTSFTYDGNTHVPTATPTGVVGSDSISFTVRGEASSVGTYTATINGMSGSGYNNYLIPQNSTCQFTISNSGSSSEASVTTAPAAKSLTYNGQLQDLVNAGTASGGTLYYSLNGTDTTPTWSTSIPQQTNAGTYNVWHKVVGDSSHTDSPVYGPMQVTIGKKEVTLTWSNTTFSYDGSSHVPSVSVSGVITGDSVSVSVSGDQTNAGTYTATASMTSQNYKLPSNYTCQFTITAPQLQLSEFNSSSPTGYYILKFNAKEVYTNNGFGLNISGNSSSDYRNIIVYIDRENNVVKCPSMHGGGSAYFFQFNENTQSIEYTTGTTVGGGRGDEYCTEVCDIASLVIQDKYGISLSYDSSVWDNNVIAIYDSNPQITLSGYIDKTRQISLQSLPEFNSSSPSGYYILKGNVSDMEYRPDAYSMSGDLTPLSICQNCVIYIDRTNSLIKVVATRDTGWPYVYGCNESTNIIDGSIYGALGGDSDGKLYFIASAAAEGLYYYYNLNYQWVQSNTTDVYIDVKRAAPVISGYIRGVPG